eukprot:CAMPEP_0178418320 /NCGR_PEP_ID=MMETSP0689_2-20121128/25026_1 /TAXON_ID=160604 /ORGANISM="Amphidinium massartii, Strain CS-259" /LENGTH=801 /DNA_ID=CAMNT_0020039707 /DNA_START=60 /DNA_END=2461 /DNA_ORIENTATION=+
MEEMQVTDETVASEILVPVAKLYHDLRLRSQVKDLLLSVAFIAVFSWFSYHRFDPVWGYETRLIYNTALDQMGGIPAAENSWCDDDTRMTEGNTNASCWWQFEDLQNLADVSHFLTDRLSGMSPVLHEVCPECSLAVTTSPQNVYALGVRDMVCSDFESDGLGYRARDCNAVDQEWRAHPRSYSTPCCTNQTLMEASILLMAWQFFQDVDSYLEEEERLGLGGQSLLRELLSDGTPTALVEGEGGVDCNFTSREVSSTNRQDLDNIFFCYLYQNIDDAGHFMQVIISRRERLLGMNFDAELRDKRGWSASWIRPTVRLWSFRFDDVSRQRGVMFVWITLLSFYVSHCIINLVLAAQVWGKWDWHRHVRVQRSLVFVPGLSLPLILEVLKPMITMPLFTILVTVSELLLLVIFMMHLEAIDSVRVIIHIVTNSAEAIVVFTLILAPLWLCMGALYSQMFGLYKYEGFAQALHDLFTIFANGQEVEVSDYTYGPTAFWLMYYVSALVLVLTLSQVFITILLDAYTKSKEDEQELLQQSQVPPQFQRIGRKYTWKEACLEGASLALFDYSFRLGDWNRRLTHGLAYAMTQQVGGNGDPVAQPMLTVLELRKALAVVGGRSVAPTRITEHYSWVRSKAITTPSPTAGSNWEKLPSNAPAVGSNGASNALANRPPLEDLRATVLAQSITAGCKIPYEELKEMTESSLRSLASSFASVAPAESMSEPLADLRASILTLAKQEGYIMSYAELQHMSRTHLDLMLRGLQTVESARRGGPSAQDSQNRSQSITSERHQRPLASPQFYAGP